VAHPTDSVVFAKLTTLDRALVIPILTPAPRIEAPRLDRGVRAARDVHVTPRWRNAKSRYPLDRRPIANDSSSVIDVCESLLRRPSPNDPPITHTSSAKASSGPPPYI